MNNYTLVDGYNQTVDLDDIELYPQTWRDMNIHELFSDCMSEAGEAMFYLKHLHPYWDKSGNQWFRVDILCKELAHIKSVPNEDEYRMALMCWRWRFEDETQNMC